MLGLGASLSIDTVASFSPLDVHPRLELWYKNAVGVTAEKWDDSSGSSNYAYQLDISKRAVVDDGGLNFEGSSNHHYDLKSAIEIVPEAPFMLFLVCTIESYDTQNSILGTGDNNVFLEIQTNRRIRLRGAGSGTAISITYPSDTFAVEEKMVVGIKRDEGITGNIHLYKNGTLITPTSQEADTGAIIFNQLASRNDDRFFDGIIHEFLFYSTEDLLPPEITKISEYLISENGI